MVGAKTNSEKILLLKIHAMVHRGAAKMATTVSIAGIRPIRQKGTPHGGIVILDA
jgi:hypothetical protein